MKETDIISSGLLELFVLGKTNESETEQVLQWINEYPLVKQEIDKIELALEQYALAHSVAPTPEVKEMLFVKINSQSDLSSNTNQNTKTKVVSINNRWKMVAAASVIIMILSSIGTYVMYNKYRNLDKKMSLVSELQKSTGGQLDMILTSNTEPIQLKGTAYSPASTAKIFWAKNTGDVYVAPSGLPQAPAGMQYQLWAIIDGKPADAGMILQNTNGNKYHLQKMKSFGKAEAFAITLETSGGSATPTMDKMYVMAKVI